MSYADVITIASTHTSTSAAKKNIQPYLHTFFSWTKHNHLISSGSYIRPQTHIKQTHSQHLSTRTQTSTNNKYTHRNSIVQTEGDTHGYLQGSHETDAGVCLFHMVASCILNQHYQTASHAERSIEDCHRMHTRHKHLLDETHTSHTRSPTCPRLTIQSENTTSPSPTYTILNTPMLKNPLSSTTTATQQTFPQIPITTTDIKTNMRQTHIYCL